jgi:predicted nuclease of predicted toxin-antitoxin system
VASLSAAGHDVAYVPERQVGISDDEVLQIAFAEGRILPTEDKDFGELLLMCAA